MGANARELTLSVAETIIGGGLAYMAHIEAASRDGQTLGVCLFVGGIALFGRGGRRTVCALHETIDTAGRHPVSYTEDERRLEEE